MIKNPYLNAFAASLYIVILVTVGFNIHPENVTPAIIAPITMISLLTFSAAIMGYLFFFEPLQIYLDGQKKQAVTFFLKTLFTFAALTIVVVGLLFFIF